MNQRQRVAFSRFPAVLLAFLLLPQESHAQEQALEMSAHVVVVDDLEIAYRIGGSGPPLLMVHGFTFTGQEYEHIAPGILAAQAADCVRYAAIKVTVCKLRLVFI